MQLSNHLFEELAMDVYDEVDRRETDAGRVKLSSDICVLSLENLHWCCSYVHLSTEHHWSHSYNITCSVVGNTESQHPGDGDNCGAFPSRESWVFINTKPGMSCFTELPFRRFIVCFVIVSDVLLMWLCFSCLGTTEARKV